MPNDNLNDGYKSDSPLSSDTNQNTLDANPPVVDQTTATKDSDTTQNSVFSNISPDASNKDTSGGIKKVLPTLLGVFFIVGAVAAGVFLVQNNQELREEAASGSTCQQSPDCELADNPGNSGSRTVSRPIIYVDITDQDYHRYNPGQNDDGCRRVNISGNTVTWEKYGSGPDCKDVSNVQIWMGNLPSPTTAPTNTPTPNATNTPTPTGSTGSPVSCPAGTIPLFASAGALNVGTSVSLGGTVSSENGSWNVSTQNGVLLASNGSKITVNFSNNVLLESVLIYDNDPKSGENPWSINGTSLPTTPGNTWGPLFNLNKTTNQMVFDNGGDSPHFNVCVKAGAPTNSPTPTVTLPPDVVAKCNAVRVYDLQGNMLSQSDLSQLNAGDKIRFAVSGQANLGTFSKARFTVNNVLQPETTLNTAGEFYMDYTIPQNTTSFTVKGEVHHSSLGWI